MNRYMILARVIIGIVLWLGLFGLWPFVHPPHDFSTPLSVVDIALHWVGLFVMLILLIEARVIRRRTHDQGA